MLEKIGSKRWWLLNWLRWVGGGDLGRPSRRNSEPHRGAREGNSTTDYGIGVTVNCLLPFPCQSSHLWVAPCPGLGRQVRAQTGGGARMWVAREPGSHPRCHCCASRSHVRCAGGVLSDSKDLFVSLMGCGVAKHLWNHCVFLDFSFGLIPVYLMSLGYNQFNSLLTSLLDQLLLYVYERSIDTIATKRSTNKFITTNQ